MPALRPSSPRRGGWRRPATQAPAGTAAARDPAGELCARRARSTSASSAEARVVGIVAAARRRRVRSRAVRVPPRARIRLGMPEVAVLLPLRDPRVHRRPQRGRRLEPEEPLAGDAEERADLVLRAYV